MKTCLSESFFSLAHNCYKYSKFSLHSWACCAQAIASLSWWLPPCLRGSPWQHKAALMGLRRLELESRIKWTDLWKTFYDGFHKVAGWIFQQVLLTGSVSYSCISFPVQLQERARISGHQADASRLPVWIMSIFQPGTDWVRKRLGPRRAFCKLVSSL